MNFRCIITCKRTKASGKAPLWVFLPAPFILLTSNKEDYHVIKRGRKREPYSRRMRRIRNFLKKR